MMRVCLEPGCPEVQDESRCAFHRRDQRTAHTLRKGNREAQGYGTAHRKERARWVPKVASGKATCARCGERISPLEDWHLDHTDDRTGYLGPSHAACNTSAPHWASNTRSKAGGG